jgi:hypothetical protein
MRAGLILISIAILTIPISAAAQEPCQKDLAEAPAVFGLKLGMTFEQMRGVLGPAIKLKPKKSGEGSYFENFIDRPSPGSLAGVRAMYLRVFNNKIYEIEIFYENNGKPVRLEDFITRLSPELALPTPLWKVTSGSGTIDCKAFTIKADVPLNPRLQITDVTAAEDFEKAQTGKKKAAKKKS